MKPRSSPAGAFIGTSFSSVLVAILTFVSGVLIARALGPEARAEYGTVLLIGQLLATLSSLSFFDAAIVRIRENPEFLEKAQPTMLAMALLLGVLATAIAAAVFPFIDLGLQEITQSENLLIVALLIFSGLVTQSYSAADRSQMKFTMVNTARVASPAVFSLLIVLAWLWQGGQLSALLVLSLFLASKVPVLTVWIWRGRKRSFGPILLPFMRKAGDTGLRLHLAVVVGTIAGQVDRLIAVGAWPKDLLGQYFVAFSAVGAGYAVVTTAITTVLLPYLAGMEPKEREMRVALIIRLTIVISLVTVLAGLCILPYVIPFLYGQEYLPATPLAIGLLLVLSILPVRAIILEASRSLGKGRPSLEMGVTSIAVMVVGYFVTGYARPVELIVTLGLANLVSMFVGARHLVAEGVIRPGTHLLPGTADVLRLWRVVQKRRL